MTPSRSGCALGKDWHGFGAEWPLHSVFDETESKLRLEQGVEPSAFREGRLQLRSDQRQLVCLSSLQQAERGLLLLFQFANSTRCAFQSCEGCGVLHLRAVHIRKHRTLGCKELCARTLR